MLHFILRMEVSEPEHSDPRRREPVAVYSSINTQPLYSLIALEELFKRLETAETTKRVGEITIMYAQSWSGRTKSVLTYVWWR